jgi:hypothetical protein
LTIMTFYIQSTRGSFQTKGYQYDLWEVEQ